MIFGDVVVVIKCSKYFLETKSKEKLDDKQVKELIDALMNVQDRVHLILVCETPFGEKKKPDSRKKIYKELTKITTPIEFASYRPYEDYKLIPIIKKMADEIELKINHSEISLLIQTVGSSLRDIASQLEKLKLYAYPDNLVSEKMVKEICCDKSDIFTLIDMVLRKEYSQALELISNILQKDHYLSVLAFSQTIITNHLKLKIYSKILSGYDLAIKMGMKEAAVRINLEKISKVPLRELVRLKINLTQAEYMLKTGLLKDAIGAFELAFISEEMEAIDAF